MFTYNVVLNSSEIKTVIQEMATVILIAIISFNDIMLNPSYFEGHAATQFFHSLVLFARLSLLYKSQMAAAVGQLCMGLIYFLFYWNM